MKTSFRLLGLFVILCSTSRALAASDEAIEACRDVNPPGVWQDCVRDYDAKLETLRQDPAWQAEQRRQEVERRRHAEEMLLRKQEIELRKRDSESRRWQQQQPLPSNCTFTQHGDRVNQVCN
jgi:hypothetical protein